MKNNNKSHKNGLQSWIRYSSLGMEMAGAVIMPTFIGYKLDEWLENNTPWLTIVFLLFGVAGAFYLVYKQLK